MKKENSTTGTNLKLFGIPKLYPYIKPYLWKIVFMVSLGVLSSLLDSFIPIFNKYAIDNFVGKGTLKGLPVFIILYVALLIVLVVDNFVCTYICGQVEMGMDRDLRNAAFNHLQELSLSHQLSL